MTEHADELDAKLLLGRYRVVQRLGEGGMGTVHLARVEGAEGFRRPVVVKRMRTDIRSSDEGNKLFKREAQILSKMQHPSIADILDFGVEDGAHIMVLEYVHGYSLSPLLDYHYNEEKPLPVDICLYIIRKVLDALHYAHHFDTEEGQEIEIVHRDVAPDNILLSKKGYVHLLDFGVASIRGPAGSTSTKVGSFRGKLGYAAPETVHGHSATPRSDQYSAAAVLLELLTQEAPFSSESIGLTVQRMVQEVPDPPSKFRSDIPPGLDEVIAKALRKDPSERFESALEFARELRKLQSEDDEDVAQKLKELIQQEFPLLPRKVDVEPLKTREDALARELASTDPTVQTREQLDTLSGEAGSPVSGMSARATTEVAASSDKSDKQVKSLLLGILIVGGVIALGLGAAVALLSKSGSGEQVVVVGEDQDQDQEQEQETAALEEEPQALAEGSTKTGADADQAAAESTKAPEQSKKPTAAAKGRQADQAKQTDQQKLSGAVQQKSAAYRSCFRQHIEAAQKSGQVSLHFSVPQAGGAAKVNVSPSSIRSAPLGTCLKSAAQQVRFPPLKKAVSFSVPVKAKVSGQ